MTPEQQARMNALNNLQGRTPRQAANATNTPPSPGTNTPAAMSSGSPNIQQLLQQAKGPQSNMQMVPGQQPPQSSMPMTPGMQPQPGMPQSPQASDPNQQAALQKIQQLLQQSQGQPQ